MQTLYLSKRNLLTLLNKLERAEQGEDTKCAIIKYRNENDPFVNTVKAITVVAVPDEKLYTKREAGIMHPADDPLLRTIKD
jgi:hypothetical protein